MGFCVAITHFICQLFHLLMVLSSKKAASPQPVRRASPLFYFVHFLVEIGLSEMFGCFTRSFDAFVQIHRRQSERYFCRAPNAIAAVDEKP